jgi:hypothetical protein
MRRLLLLLFLMGVAGVAKGINFGNHDIPIDKGTYVGDNRADGREGGESWGTALPIPSLPYQDSGATCDNVDDITLPCADSAAPDVVYSYIPSTNQMISVSLCGSGYDTALAVYDSAQNILACNDDFCGLQSEVQGVQLVAGQTYYFVVDGFSTNCGSYQLTIPCCPPVNVECPAGAPQEGEPPCGDNYWDTWNGGCNSQGFQLICPQEGSSAVMCGKSGTYNYYGSNYRDTDWYYCYGTGSTMTASVVAEFQVQLIFFYIIDYNCAAFQYDSVNGAPLQEVALSHTIADGEVAWIYVGPSVFVGVPCESDYVLNLSGISGLGPDCIGTPTQKESWGRIKNLFR